MTLRGSEKWNGRCVAKVERRIELRYRTETWAGQCYRKAVEQVDGKPLCRQHEGMWASYELGLLKEPPFPVVEEMLADG